MQWSEVFEGAYIARHDVVAVPVYTKHAQNRFLFFLPCFMHSPLQCFLIGKCCPTNLKRNLPPAANRSVSMCPKTLLSLHPHQCSVQAVLHFVQSLGLGGVDSMYIQALVDGMYTQPTHTDSRREGALRGRTDFEIIGFLCGQKPSRVYIKGMGEKFGTLREV